MRRSIDYNGWNIWRSGLDRIWYSLPIGAKSGYNMLSADCIEELKKKIDTWRTERFAKEEREHFYANRIEG